ncbi:hypothetical protein HY745_06420, partial [Candidatus Desantisbacteria bacterium]|nr:hypothetical protein [Candidatus Desantisbacteria bacterium]
MNVLNSYITKNNSFSSENNFNNVILNDITFNNNFSDDAKTQEILSMLPPEVSDFITSSGINKDANLKIDKIKMDKINDLISHFPNCIFLKLLTSYSDPLKNLQNTSIISSGIRNGGEDNLVMETKKTKEGIFEMKTGNAAGTEKTSKTEEPKFVMSGEYILKNNFAVKEEDNLVMETKKTKEGIFEM